jgi:hypothetical protein
MDGSGIMLVIAVGNCNFFNKFKLKFFRYILNFNLKIINKVSNVGKIRETLEDEENPTPL